MTGDDRTITTMDENEFQRYLDIVVCVFKEKDAAGLRKVKEFLYSLSSPRQKEQTLAAAVLYFAEHDRQVFEWILSHQESLSPELDLFGFTRSLIRARLIDKGWLQDRDFRFDLQSLLCGNSLLRQTFEEYFSQGELLLIREMFEIKP